MYNPQMCVLVNRFTWNNFSHNIDKGSIPSQATRRIYTSDNACRKTEARSQPAPMNFDLEEGDDANKFKVLKGFIVQKHFPLNKFFLAVYLLGSLRSLLLIYIYPWVTSKCWRTWKNYYIIQLSFILFLTFYIHDHHFDFAYCLCRCSSLDRISSKLKTEGGNLRVFFLGHQYILMNMIS